MKEERRKKSVFLFFKAFKGGREGEEEEGRKRFTKGCFERGRERKSSDC